ncbi:asparagine synthase [Westerdykella ornata]|uniref:Asparagine synthase n=1 Tax=Westerdykella ornata TaxID=318751 RepID=A0A6A6JMI5_WESOR|nr:asparagine synthase [Westerdykella ornata]KAF2277333.1 asparagine synthase [Westerdykella ornata]
MEPFGSSETHSRVAILFSGGLDCTILARLSHDLLPATEPIDLLNVAFENPRIHSKLETGVSPYDLCPDRLTGRASYAELVQTCPNRIWRFVEINVPYPETLAHREKLIKLIHPHNTEMDLSIAYALYFAASRAGLAVIELDSSLQPYTTTAHVLLSGLGADELFGGYQRHALAFSRRGYPGLIDELALDFHRLGKRNLGRDDRVISDSGREVRFPYLDEDFIALALELPVWAKCDFGNAQEDGSEDPARFLEPGKRILRRMAWELGMKRVAQEKKRAIQFGARTAKMETGRSKGTQLLS